MRMASALSDQIERLTGTVRILEYDLFNLNKIIMKVICISGTRSDVAKLFNVSGCIFCHVNVAREG